MTQAGYQIQPKGINGLGVAALCIGLVCVLGCWIPLCGMVVIPFAIVGLILGIVGFMVASSGGRSGVGFPVAGSAVCLLSIAVSVLMTIGFIGAASTAASQQQQQMQRFPTSAVPIGPTVAPPPPVNNAITVAIRNHTLVQGMTYVQALTALGNPTTVNNSGTTRTASWRTTSGELWSGTFVNGTATAITHNHQ